MLLRKHQREFKEVIDGIMAGSPVKTIIVNATPGSGKSLIPLLAGSLITAGKADRLAWVCPRSSLQDQGERNFLDSRFRSLLGHNLTIRSSTNDENPCHGLDGFITTAQAVGVDKNQTVLRDFRRHRYVLIIDEGHHSADGGEGDEGAWMQAMEPLCEAAAYVVIMSGTMSRHDGKKIAFIPYRQTDEDEYRPCFEGREDIAYIECSRADALAEKAIIPLEFILHDGQARWEKEGKEKQAKISTGRVGDSKGALFTALHTGYAHELLDTALVHWNAWRRDHKSSLFLAVAANIKVTKEYTDYLTGQGLRCDIATSDDDKGAAKAIKAYKAGKLDALISCQVCYEGLDVPAISHIACLTRIRSIGWITQMCGRAVRIDPQAGPYETQKGHIFAPADRMFVELARKIEADQCEAVARIAEKKEARESNGNGGAGPSITPLSSKLIQPDGQGSMFFIDDYRPVVKSSPNYNPNYYQQTQREIERELREEIDDHVKAFCRVYNVRIAALNKQLKEMYGKSRDRMTVRELEALKSYLSGNYEIPQRREPGVVLVPVPWGGRG
jgi:superfamily II DNA or RNA helicase